jgi:pimeloyl-ACP methyl ester carboxylesterase
MEKKAAGEFEISVRIAEGTLFTKTWVPVELKDHIPLLLFHDSLGCVRMWRDFPQVLSEKLGKVVIAYDRLGFGQSSERKNIPSKNFINEEAEIYFPKILSELKIDKFDLFGHSVGGAMAIACAAKLANCRTVVTEAAQAFVEDRTLNGIRKAEQDFKSPENFERLVKYHGAKASWVLRAWTDVWLSVDFANWTLVPSLKKVDCPVQVIHGDSDEYGSNAFPELICKSVRGKSKMQILSNCGHIPHREKTEEVLKIINDFYLTV